MLFSRGGIYGCYQCEVLSSWSGSWNLKPSIMDGVTCHVINSLNIMNIKYG